MGDTNAVLFFGIVSCAWCVLQPPTRQTACCGSIFVFKRSSVRVSRGWFCKQQSRDTNVVECLSSSRLHVLCYSCSIASPYVLVTFLGVGMGRVRLDSSRYISLSNFMYANLSNRQSTCCAGILGVNNGWAKLLDSCKFG